MWLNVAILKKQGRGVGRSSINVIMGMITSITRGEYLKSGLFLHY